MASIVDHAPEFLVGQYIGEGNVETFSPASGYTPVKGDLVSLTTGDRTVTGASKDGKIIGVVLAIDKAGVNVSVLVRGKTKLTIASDDVESGDQIGAYSTKGIYASGTNAFGVTIQDGPTSGDSVLVIISCVP